MPDQISVSEFVSETNEDYKSPTASNFTTRMAQCRNTVAAIEEVSPGRRAGKGRRKGEREKGKGKEGKRGAAPSAWLRPRPAPSSALGRRREETGLGRPGTGKKGKGEGTRRCPPQPFLGGTRAGTGGVGSSSQPRFTPLRRVC